MPRRRYGPIRRYFCTVASFHYDQRDRQLKAYEMHFQIDRQGTIENVRRELSEQAVPYFRRTVLRTYQQSIPLKRIRVGFERELTLEDQRAQPITSVVGRKMEFSGDKWRAFPLTCRPVFVPSARATNHSVFRNLSSGSSFLDSFLYLLVRPTRIESSFVVVVSVCVDQLVRPTEFELSFQ